MALMALAAREALAIPSYAEVDVMVHDELGDITDRLGWNTDGPLKRALELSQKHSGQKECKDNQLEHEQADDEFAEQYKQAMSGNDEAMMALLARRRYPHMLDDDTTADIR